MDGRGNTHFRWMRSAVHEGLDMESQRLDRHFSSTAFVGLWAEVRDGSPRKLDIEAISNCLRSHRSLPITWAQSLFPQAGTSGRIGFWAKISRSICGKKAPISEDVAQEARADQACAEGASQRASAHGNRLGSSCKSTMPLLLVSVHKLQSYSNELQVILFSISSFLHFNHSVDDR